MDVLGYMEEDRAMPTIGWSMQHAGWYFFGQRVTMGNWHNGELKKQALSIVLGRKPSNLMCLPCSGLSTTLRHGQLTQRTMMSACWGIWRWRFVRCVPQNAVDFVSDHPPLPRSWRYVTDANKLVKDKETTKNNYITIITRLQCHIYSIEYIYIYRIHIYKCTYTIC